MTAQKLKNAILQLAVQGKLVPQNPSDEPAETLLKKIRKEKDKLVREGKIRKEKLLTPINDEEIPFEIPESWVWVRLGEIFQHNTGKALNKSDTEGKLLTYITTSNLYWNRFELDSLRQMLFTDSEIDKCTAQKGDLLVCEGGDVGRSAIWYYDKPIRIQNHIHKLRAYIKVCTEYFYYIFYLYKYTGLINGKGVALPGLSSGVLHNLLVPLPPLAEQKRIVEKIEELLPLVERYGVAEEELQRLNAEFPEQLRKSILQQAVQGKLVPQNPADGAAEELLKKIRKEKDKLVREGKIKKEKPLPEITEDEIPFEIPESWAWVRLGEICEYGKCENIEPIDLPENVWILELEDIEKQTGKILKRHYSGSYLTKSTKHLFKKGNVLFSKLRPNLNKVVVADDNGCCTSEILPLDFGELYPYYMQLFLMSPGVVEYLTSKAFGQKMPRVGTSTGINLLVPLPPLAEQKRIVEKIESLLPLCDELKQR